ncbi:TolB-like translocation protein [Edaphobacillus lindanitolerans]|uniref:WD40-like Beta Propeller Repeat n=1 Tax=Edaphobacillus lindanitolerans TaxID=550447 RepID=A0A1U7PR02_9BACI|nr:WD40 repeat domain-containing protein [Edaphobacillus lindanitolerans]SIT92702.1 WD40-like Beta Propeller Repeat [Edaphobacillus lindanitolerans]
MKRPLLIALILIGAATAASAAAGLALQKPENETEEGFSGVYDVTADGSIAVVSFTEGRPGIYLLDEEAASSGPLAESGTDSRINSLSFSPDGRSIAFTVSPKDPAAGGLKSIIRLLDLESGTERAVFQDKGLITELTFSPDDPDLIYFLRAGVFENYSPVAAQHPHDFDVHEYRLSENNTRPLTDLKAYDMQSLDVPAGSDSVYFSMFGDEEYESAEETFDATQQIYRIPEEGGTPEPAGDGYPRDVYGFAIIPDGGAIYQAVSKTSDEGIFEYELFRSDSGQGNGRQLTRMRTHAGNPVLSPDGKTLWFVEDRNFGKERPDFHLYRMPADGGTPEALFPAE